MSKAGFISSTVLTTKIAPRSKFKTAKVKALQKAGPGNLWFRVYGAATIYVFLESRLLVSVNMGPE